jgi:hypothetical protein
MKCLFKKVLIACCACISLNAIGQREKSADHIKKDPDWQIIVNNNIDFLNRALRQGNSISDLWEQGASYFLEQLNYTREEYERRHTETRDAALRLLSKYALIGSTECETCKEGEQIMLARADRMIDNIRMGRSPAPESLLRAIDNAEDGDIGPKCGLQFYLCVLGCAATIEFFPAYLLCCGGCMCRFCKNPPAWC